MIYLPVPETVTVEMLSVPYPPIVRTSGYRFRNTYRQSNSSCCNNSLYLHSGQGYLTPGGEGSYFPISATLTTLWLDFCQPFQGSVSNVWRWGKGREKSLLSTISDMYRTYKALCLPQKVVLINWNMFISYQYRKLGSYLPSRII